MEEFNAFNNRNLIKIAFSSLWVLEEWFLCIKMLIIIIIIIIINKNLSKLMKKKISRFLLIKNLILGLVVMGKGLILFIITIIIAVLISKIIIIL
jgi:hypothetical protein